MARAAILLALALLAGCAQLPAETPEETAQRHVLACREAGLAADTDAGRLCLLMERQNDRLAQLERRLRLIESQTLTPPVYGPYRWW